MQDDDHLNQYFFAHLLSHLKNNIKKNILLIQSILMSKLFADVKKLVSRYMANLLSI